MVIHPQFLRQFTRRAGAGDEAFGDVLIGSFVFRPHMLVKDNVRIVFRQGDNRRRDFIAGLHFVKEAVPLLVNKNSAAAANRFGNQVRSLLFDGGVNLNFAHIHGASADAFQQRDTAPGRPFVVGGHETVEVRTILHHHRAVGAEAAGGHYDAFGLHFDDFFFVVDQTYTAHLIPAHQDLFHRGIQQDVDAAFGDVAHQAANQIAADR